MIPEQAFSQIVFFANVTLVLREAGDFRLKLSHSTVVQSPFLPSNRTLFHAALSPNFNTLERGLVTRTDRKGPTVVPTVVPKPVCDKMILKSDYTQNSTVVFPVVQESPLYRMTFSNSIDV